MLGGGGADLRAPIMAGSAKSDEVVIGTGSSSAPALDNKVTY